MNDGGQSPEITGVRLPSLPDKFNHSKPYHLSPLKDALVNELREQTLPQNKSQLPTVTKFHLVDILREEKQDLDNLKGEEEKFIKTDASADLLNLIAAKRYFATHKGENECKVGETTFHRDTISDTEACLNPYYKQQREMQHLLDYAVNLAASDSSAAIHPHARELQRQALLAYLDLNWKRWKKITAAEALSVKENGAVEHAIQNAAFFQALQKLVLESVPGMSDKEASADPAYTKLRERYLQQEREDANVNEHHPFLNHMHFVEGQISSPSSSPRRDAFLTELAKQKETGAKSMIGFGDIAEMFDKEKDDCKDQYASFVQELSEAQTYFANNPQAEKVAMYTVDGSSTTAVPAADKEITATHLYAKKDLKDFEMIAEAMKDAHGVHPLLQTAQEAAIKLKHNVEITENDLKQLAVLAVLLKQYQVHVVPDSLNTIVALLAQKTYTTFNDKLQKRETLKDDEWDRIMSAIQEGNE